MRRFLLGLALLLGLQTNARAQCAADTVAVFNGSVLTCTLALANLTSLGSAILRSDATFLLPATISPTISGNQDDWAPTGISTATQIRVDGGASSRNITGITASSSGRILILTNIGSTSNIILKNLVTSTAGNQFSMDADITLTPGQSITIRYDSTSSKWRPVNNIGGVSLGGTNVWTGSNTFNSTILVLDNSFSVRDESDATKLLAFQLSGITTGNTRTMTIPDASGTLALTGNKLSVFAATTSAEFAGVISDETGTGAVVLADSPVFTTLIRSPKLIGGTGTTGTQLSLQTTTGNGTTDTAVILGGNNGATTFATFAAATTTAPTFSASTAASAYKIGSDVILFVSGNYTQINSPATLSASLTFGNSGDSAMYISANTQIIFRTVANSTYTTFTPTTFATVLGASAQANAVCYNSSTTAITYNSGVTTCLASSANFKDIDYALTPDEGERIVLAMRPWLYTYKDTFDGFVPGQQMGFVSEEVWRIEPRLAAHNDKGQLTGVRYEQYTAALTAAFQKLKSEVEDLKRRVP